MGVEPWLTSVTLPTRTTQTAHLPTRCLNKTRKQMGTQSGLSPVTHPHLRVPRTPRQCPPQPPCVSSLAESPGLGVKRCRFEAQLPPTQDQLCAENITGNAEHQGLLWKGPPSVRTRQEPKYNKRGLKIRPLGEAPGKAAENPVVQTRFQPETTATRRRAWHECLQGLPRCR